MKRIFQVVILMVLSVYFENSQSTTVNQQKINQIEDTLLSSTDIDVNYISFSPEKKLYPTAEGIAGAFNLISRSIDMADGRAIMGSEYASTTGAAFIFEKLDSQWREVGTLRPQTGGVNASYAFSVAIKGDWAFVGNPSDNVNGVYLGAVYTYKFQNNQWTEHNKLIPTEMIDFEQFGYSLSVYDKWLLVGAPKATEDGIQQGKVYIYQLINDQWTEFQEISASDGELLSNYGKSVDLHSNTALVGATGNDSVYVLEYNDSMWIEKQIIQSPSPSSTGNFGSSVSIYDDTVIVGAPEHYANPYPSGAAYVYRHNQGSNKFIFEEKLLASDRREQDNFGSSVDVNENTIVVGRNNLADFRDEAAYVFKNDGNDWIETQILQVEDNIYDSKSFGVSVKLDADHLLISAERDETNGLSSGAAYIFEDLGSSLEQTDKLIPIKGAQDTYFGNVIDVSGEWAIVGVPDSGGFGSESSAVYFYKLIHNQWVFNKKSTPDAVNSFDQFGSAVKIDGSWAFVGAPNFPKSNEIWGKVFTYKIEQEEWVEDTSYFPTENPGDNSRFGEAISFDSQRVAIAAPSDSENGNGSGSVYIFDLVDESWSETQKIFPSDGGSFEYFGRGLLLSGVNLYVGATGHRIKGESKGAVYWYRFENGVWEEKQKIVIPDIVTGSHFGGAIVLHDGLLVVGAPDDEVEDLTTGSVYLFEQINDLWVQSDWIYPIEGNVNSKFGRLIQTNGNHLFFSNFGQNSTSSIESFSYDGTSWMKSNSAFIFDDPPYPNGYTSTFDIAGEYLFVGAPGDDVRGTNSGSIYVYKVKGDLIFKNEME